MAEAGQHRPAHPTVQSGRGPYPLRRAPPGEPPDPHGTDGGLLDIDHFKELNDTLGHGAGDQILTAFGQRVRHLFRPDDIVSRFGGDEFLVVMKKMGKRAFAETKLGQLCRQEVQIADMREPIQVSSSISVAFFPRDGVEFDDLLRKADRALYASKRDGRGRVCFYEDLV